MSKIEVMASGRLALVLSDKVNWEEFPTFAQSTASRIGAEIWKKSDAPDMRIWSMRRNGIMVRLVWEDYPFAISLEATDSGGDEEIKKLAKVL